MQKNQPKDALPDLSDRPLHLLRPRYLIPAAIALILLVCVVIYKQVVRAQVNKQLAALKLMGYPLTSAELNDWNKAVPTRENAALKVLEAASFFSTNNLRFDKIKWPPAGERLTSETKSKLQEFLTVDSKALVILEEAWSLPLSRYPVDWRPGPGAILPHLARVSHFAELLRAQAALAADTSNSVLAVSSIDSLLKLSGTLITEPCLVSQLVRLKLANYAILSLERTLNECALNPEQLHSLLTAFDSLDRETQEGLTRALVGEVTLGNYVFNAPLKELQGISESLDDSHLFLFGFLQATGLQDKDHLFFLQSMTKAIEASQKNNPEGYAVSRQASAYVTSKTQGKTLLYISRMILPALDRPFAKFAMHEAGVRCSKTALALELYRQENGGKSPPELNALLPKFLAKVCLDPFTGMPLRYRPMSQGYMVYSVGADLVDNGGLGQDGSKNMDEIFGTLNPPRASQTNAPQDICFVVWR
jgi:hypothetical protein